MRHDEVMLLGFSLDTIVIGAALAFVNIVYMLYRGFTRVDTLVKDVLSVQKEIFITTTDTIMKTAEHQHDVNVFQRDRLDLLTQGVVTTAAFARAIHKRQRQPFRSRIATHATW